MTPAAFVAKWQPADLSERSAYQQHFLDLCAVLGQPTPAAADPTGDWYTFEKGVTKDAGGKGFADVWKKGHFGWEYKGKRKNLADAYRQLAGYREALANPPLLIVCDLNRFEVHTNFTGTLKEVHAFDLDGLTDPHNLAILKHAFTAPDQLRPGRTQKQVTEEIAARFGKLADGLRGRGVDPHAAGHFLMKLMFCMFAEDIGLLPENLFLESVAAAKGDPARLAAVLTELFAKMNAGGMYGREKLDRFNGSLFADAAVVPLTGPEIDELIAAARCDWSHVSPTIFGTLFERILDPGKRSQLGAHYTDRTDIETLLRPVLLAPLRREWDAVRVAADGLWAKAKRTKAGSKGRREFENAVGAFLNRLKTLTVLDPACGSGNFLYVALNLLLDLELEVLTYLGQTTGQTRIPGVRPTQLRGIEVNPYARELAQVVIWIGYLQWVKENGFQPSRDPVLDPMDSIQNRDAVLTPDGTEPDWPAAEFIVGNPPFLGGKMLRANLGDEYVERLFRVWKGRVAAEADLVVYWFEKSRAMIEAGQAKRAGLLATQGIRGGANRDTLARIKETGDIFFAVSDREWVLDGAAVHISMVGFDDGSETNRVLDDRPVNTINANLTSAADTTQAKRLAANLGKCFIGTMKKGPLDVDDATAVSWLSEPNAHGVPNSDVVRPWMNGMHVTQRAAPRWIIDYPMGGTEGEAARYEYPFKHVLQEVKPLRNDHREAVQAKFWWRQARPSPDLQRAVLPLERYLCIPRVAKHRLFVWVASSVVPDGQLVAVATDGDYDFGVLHSRIHAVWAYSQGTQVREKESGFRYTPTTCFETFPFPEPTAPQRAGIAAAAKELDHLRTNWLNPPDWTRTEVLAFPGSADGPWRRFVHAPNAAGVGTVRYPRTVPKDAASAAQLKKRTLTNLYNERPAWLAHAHRRLDEAVAAAYGWPADLSDDALLANLLALNRDRAAG